MGTYNVISSAGYIVGSAIGGSVISTVEFATTFGIGLALSWDSVALLRRKEIRT